MNASNMHTSKLKNYTVLNWTDEKVIKVKDYMDMVVKIISMYQTLVHYFPTFQAPNLHDSSYQG